YHWIAASNHGCDYWPHTLCFVYASAGTVTVTLPIRSVCCTAQPIRHVTRTAIESYAKCACSDCAICTGPAADAIAVESMTSSSPSGTAGDVTTSMPSSLRSTSEVPAPSSDVFAPSPVLRLRSAPKASGLATMRLGVPPLFSTSAITSASGSSDAVMESPSMMPAVSEMPVMGG